MQIKEATSGFLLPCTLHYISQELAKNLLLWLSQAFSIFQAGEGHLGLQPGLLSPLSQVMELLKDGQQRVGLTASATPGLVGQGELILSGPYPLQWEFCS